MYSYASPTRRRHNRRPIRHQSDDCCETHTFLCVLAYQILHVIVTTLRNNNEYLLWGTIRKESVTHSVITIALPTQSGEDYTIRKPARVEPHHREIFATLEMDSSVSRYPSHKQKHGL